ncbi:MAG: site-specific DNA-methyltransferase [Phycisphaerales bacterium]|nr:site-specific DNA-methyltransferase [Phycisphaerales bacterium]
MDSLRHSDTRVNIPTEELRDFVKQDEQAPAKMLYPRDPSLDPQLVWRGKDEQDAADLQVPVVPIYIQEKIHPQAIIDDFRAHVGREKAKHEPQQLTLYADFNGLPEDFADRVDFYSQKDENQAHWSNRMILGDSLLVMTSLAEKEGLKGKVQTIYLDPPYGIRFGSNWQVSTRKRDVKDGKAEDASRQPEQVRAFRDTWKLGIHSYLAYLRDRLRVAQELLTETGSIFVQIGDENVHLVRCVMDEVFGSENFCALISCTKTSSATTELLPGVADYILWYAKKKREQGKINVKYRDLYSMKAETFVGSAYGRVLLPNGKTRKLSTHEKLDPSSLPKGAKIYRIDNLTSQRPPGDFPIEFNGRTYRPNRGYWKTGEPGMEKLKHADRLEATHGGLYYVRFFDDFPVVGRSNMWTDTVVAGFASDKRYVVETSTKIIERCLLMTTDPGDLVLDPTCGSGTTAYVAEQWGRRWITCDTSRVALALARTRLMAAKFPYYHLADDYPNLPTTAMADDEIKQYLRDTPPATRPEGRTAHNVRRGFVYKRVPHVTLKSIANNPDIKDGMSREAIDAAIAKHAETETLFDQPYEDSRVVRVTGPFTVESLSPHRTISVEEKKALAQPDPQTGIGIQMLAGSSFTNMILDNLRKAGVENTKKGERLKFDSLEVMANPWLHAQGTFAEKDGSEKRVAICIGPEHGTVGSQLIKEAAKEAVKGVGFDVLLICGFAFDPSVTEEAKRYGDLIVLPARMNPDLAMGDELLKKTGAGNLFMVFGEPDIDIKKAKDGTVTVEIRGLDVYDPTTGAIRSSSTDDIACWFIDTNYNGESFFVRHAYFTGADEPYKRLQRALRAEVDEDAWSELYSTVSRPFDKPSTGRIAIKVINHYGDEVMQVFEIE